MRQWKGLGRVLNLKFSFEYYLEINSHLIALLSQLVFIFLFMHLGPVQPVLVTWWGNFSIIWNLLTISTVAAVVVKTSLILYRQASFKLVLSPVRCTETVGADRGSFDTRRFPCTQTGNWVKVCFHNYIAITSWAVNVLLWSFGDGYLQGELFQKMSMQCLVVYIVTDLEVHLN